MKTAVELLESKMGVQADGYAKKYKREVEALEGSLLAKVEGIKPHHIVQLGKQLEAWETYQALCESNGTLNNLGQLPKLAYDVIPAVLGTLPLSVIASVQAVEAQKGIVHFKNVRALNTKGNRQAGDVFLDPRKGETMLQGYSSNLMVEDLGVGDGTETEFTAILTAKPARSQFLKITVEDDATTIGEDRGAAYNASPDIGQIYGQGVFGTVNYKTGEVSVKFFAAPAATKKIKVAFQQNLEAAAEIAKIESFWDSREIETHAYALSATIGMLQAFTLQKAVGESAIDEMTKDLVRAVNQEVFGDLLLKLIGAAQGTTTFYRNGGSGVSQFEQKMTYTDRLHDAESVMVGNAGRGGINVMVVGRSHAAVVASMPGFEKLSDGKQLGAHIWGKLNGITYIRHPEDAVMGGAWKGIGIFKGDSPFDAAAVYSPFMPLALTADLPMQNPLVNQKAAAMMAGVDVLVPQYVTNFNVDPTTPQP